MRLRLQVKILLRKSEGSSSISMKPAIFAENPRLEPGREAGGHLSSLCKTELTRGMWGRPAECMVGPISSRRAASVIDDKMESFPIYDIT